jgi:hypothetical protein
MRNVRSDYPGHQHDVAQRLMVSKVLLLRARIGRQEANRNGSEGHCAHARHFLSVEEQNVARIRHPVACQQDKATNSWKVTIVLSSISGQQFG